MAPRIGVVVFPGTNCEHDVVQAVEAAGGTRVSCSGTVTTTSARSTPSCSRAASPTATTCGPVRWPASRPSWRPSARSPGPGARWSASATASRSSTEAGLLPGALQKNGRLRFLCEPARLVVASTSSVLTVGLQVGDELVIPINHFSGNYTCDDETLRRLNDEDRVVLRYADNPNGSVDAIAGIANEAGNVVGLDAAPRARQPCAARLRRRAGAAAIARRCGERRRRLTTAARTPVHSGVPSNFQQRYVSFVALHDVRDLSMLRRCARAVDERDRASAYALVVVVLATLSVLAQARRRAGVRHDPPAPRGVAPPRRWQVRRHQALRARLVHGVSADVG